MSNAARRHEPDAMSEEVKRVAASFESLRAENNRLKQLLADADKMNSHKDGEISVLQRQLDREVSERGYWQTYAVQMSNGLGDIGNIVSGVVQRAKEAAGHEAEAAEVGSPSLPAIEIPLFMRNMRAQEQQGGQN